MWYESVVHHLCHKEDNTLCYPKELPSDYYVNGSFYLIGEKDKSSLKTYAIWAVHSRELIRLELSRVEGNESFLEVSVGEIGRFLFQIESVAKSNWLIQSRDINSPQPLYALWRLRAWNNQLFDSACKNKNFYFVGNAGLEDTLSEQ